MSAPPPRSNPAPAPSRASREAAPPDCSGLLVLVVDDNRDAAVALESLLDLAGARVELAFDGPSALARAALAAPDAVVMDLGLPGLSGHEVARRMRARGFQGAIVVLSGHGQPEDLLRSTEAGADLHLVKPADPSELLGFLATSKN